MRIGVLGTWLAALLAGAAAAAASPVDAELAQALAGAPEGAVLRVEVVLRDGTPLPLEPGFAAERRARVAALQDAVLAVVPPAQFAPIHRYQSIAGLAGHATAAGVAALASHPHVARISLDGALRPALQQGRALIGADAAHGTGYTGAGVTVAVLDTGVDSDHPDLADDLVDEKCFCSVATGCCPDGTSVDESAEDGQGHGTSVAGIVTSSGAQASLGVAPDAALIAVKVLPDSGSGTFSDTAAGLDWLLTNHVGGAPLVVNMSLGDGGQYTTASQGSCDDSNTASAIAALHAAGVPVVVASGNEGHDNGVSFPACVAQAISVGGVYDADLGNVGWCGALPLCVLPECSDDSGADVFVCHSNSGAILDVLAPDYRTRTSGLGGGVQASFGGTSAASPYAAAQVALLLQAEPSLDPEALRTLLASHGPMVTNPDNGRAFRRTQISAAIQSLPEPGALAAIAAGGLAVAGLARRRSRQAGTSSGANEKG